MKERLLFRPSIKNFAAIIILSTLNIGLFHAAKTLQLPFWLDTVGTMAAAVAIVIGLLVGLTTEEII